MTDQDSPKIVIVCEGSSDLPTARGFAERILREHLEWLRDVPEALPTWGGLRENQPFLKWTAVDDEFDDAGQRQLNRQGHFNGLPGKDDSKIARKALQLIAYLYRNHRAPLAIVLMRDADSKPIRREGLEQARQEFEKLVGHQVLIGFADPKSEAWIIAGFQPNSAREHEHLENFKSKNSFDPTREPHKLRSRENDTRDAKSVLAKLTSDDAAREEPCWSETPLEILHANGENCGLKAYLEEIESRLVPLFDPRHSR